MVIWDLIKSSDITIADNLKMYKKDAQLIWLTVIFVIDRSRSYSNDKRLPLDKQFRVHNDRKVADNSYLDENEEVRIYREIAMNSLSSSRVGSRLGGEKDKGDAFSGTRRGGDSLSEKNRYF